MIKGKQDLNYFCGLDLNLEDLKMNKELIYNFLFPWKKKLKKTIRIFERISNFWGLVQENRIFSKKRVINYRPIFIYYTNRSLIIGIKDLSIASFPIYKNYWVRVKGRSVFSV